MLSLSLNELEQMVAALQALATIKEDMVLSHEEMESTMKTNELHIAVLKQEVETAGDFLVEQESRLVRANQTINDLIRKLRSIED